MADKTLSVSRVELKHHINYFQYISLSQRLSNVLVEDKHNGDRGYTVRSLYFDDYGDSDFYQKLAGLENRKKIRLRVYSPTDSKAKLEIKRKYGDSQEKKTVLIDKSDAEELIQQNYEVLRKYDSETASSIYHIMKLNKLRPVVLIEYRRKAFTHPMNNIRITLDNDIRSSETNFGLFKEDTVLVPTDDYDTNILEIKYNNFIFKYITDLFASYDLERQSYSKYMVSRGIFERYMG
ncbi:polyphosphate polymerase domain-containing protein [Jeotgalibaca sp. MA1X17-3]|uniref:polyphosphate polymerase domain-containing protein n=1 Tax=Jeotgalibaca sp. MA1X17-3 TaxID=2908211 RepID=UPI001F1C67E4|nr:polyphosphate polymerase domain-containing protein [Jeotgalibaca sp. MA1X17-3]UJF15415.1 polyphosphate polymerase domain-containing protein [Jeotgalibaca sp. MA1X17-3]